MKLIYRQGDVGILVADKPVDTTKHEKAKRERGGIVLAHGEVTGHRHQVRDRNVCLLRAEGIHDAVLTVGRELAELTHEEHGTIPIQRGDYVVRIKREFDWASESARQVVD